MTNITDSPLEILIRVLLETYFSDSRCLFMFTDRLNNLEFRPEIPVVNLRVYKELNPEVIFRHHGCQDVLIYHQDATGLFKQFENLIRINSERFNNRRYILSGDNAMEIFTTKELEYVTDILVVVPREVLQSYDLLTRSCEGQVRILDTWFVQNLSFQNGYDLFPENRYPTGCRLKIGTFTYEPYSVVDENSTTVHGTETSFIFELINKYNMTPTFTIITGDDLWGDIFENWTGTGILGSLVNDEVDIGYGAIYTWEEYYKYLDYSKPLTRTGITVLVPSPRLAAGWFTPLYSFSLEMWMAVLLVFIFDSVILSLLFYRDHKRQYVEDSILTLTQLYLLQSLTVPMRDKLLKYFIALNMLSVLLLSCSYSSGLSSVMTVPRYENAIKSVNDLALSGLPWGAPTDAWLISLRQVHEEKYQIIKDNFVVKTEEDLRVESRSNGFGFALERLPYGHFAVGPYVKGDVISNYLIMQEDIYWEQCIFVVRKNSVLLPLLDRLLLRVFQAGLAAFWENEVVAQYMDMSVQRGIIYHTQEHTISKLSWTQIEGAFAILALGYITSTLAFLAEIVNKRRRQHAKNLFKK